MKIAKRVALFALVNILIVVTLSILISVLGISPTVGGKELEVWSLALFCLVWGVGAAFISLALSRVMAKWMMGVRVINPHTCGPSERDLVEKVYSFSRQAGLQTMPEVGIYESPELNAFATGPTQNRALVAVSRGLIESLNVEAVDGVLAHEVAHVANGDMVTMTLVQGVVNAFVMFLARIVAWLASQFVEESRRGLVQFGIVLALEIGLGLLGMMVVAYFSRQREYRADAGGAALAGPAKMIAALRALKRAYYRGDTESVDDGQAPALATLKISGKAGGLFKLMSTHPELDDRIDRLEEMRFGGRASLGTRRLTFSG